MTSFSRPPGPDCGVCARAEPGSHVRSPNNSAAEALSDEDTIGFSFCRLIENWTWTACPGQSVQSRRRASILKLESRRGSVDLGYWSRCDVKRDCNTRYLACIGVNPVIQPARENYEESRLRPDPKRLAVGIAWSRHGLQARPGVEKLQNTAERLVCAAGSRIHIIRINKESRIVRDRLHWFPYTCCSCPSRSGPSL